MSININHDTNVIAATNIALVLTTNATEKLRITNAGGVSFGATGTAVGTAGQVLQSNGDASPTWVAAPASTPIGAIVTGIKGVLNAPTYLDVSAGQRVFRTTYPILSTYYITSYYTSASFNTGFTAQVATSRGEDNYFLTLQGTNTGGVVTAANTGFITTTGGEGVSFTTPISAIWYKVLYSTTRSKFFAISTTLAVIGSTDNTGTSWTSLTSLPTQYTWINFIEVAGNLYVFAAEKIVYISTDGGSTWTSYSTEILYSSATIQAVLWNGSNFVHITSNGNNAGVSADGITWRQQTLNFASGSFNTRGTVINGSCIFLPTSGSTLFVVDSSWNVYRPTTFASVTATTDICGSSTTNAIIISGGGSGATYIGSFTATKDIVWQYSLQGFVNFNAIPTMNSFGYILYPKTLGGGSYYTRGTADSTSYYLPILSGTAISGTEIKLKAQ